MNISPASGSAATYKVIVPTRNSERWIGVFHAHYRQMGITPAYLVDFRSEDRTLEILRDLKAEVHVVTPTQDRVESMLALTTNLVAAEWVIRFDDDELPSRALIQWLDEHLAGVEALSLAMSRRDAGINAGSLCYSRMEHFYFLESDLTFLDPQWRGFRPRRVQFHDAIHSPGFDHSNYALVPQHAYFVHFDWILRSEQERWSKLQSYERQRPGAGWSFAQFYLPERHAPESNRWTSFETTEFEGLIQQFTASV